MLDTQPTSYPPLNLEEEEKKKNFKKNFLCTKLTTREREREREILTPELQSTVDMYLH